MTSSPAQLSRIGRALLYVGTACSMTQGPAQAADEQSALAARLAQAVRPAVRQHIRSGEVPGAITLVARDGHLEFLDAQGVADAQAKTPLRKDTVFWMASMTKPITAVAVMMLVDEGKLQLSAPVSQYIPEFHAEAMVRTLRPGSAAPAAPAPGAAPDPNAPRPQYDLTAASRSITLQDLLTHTAGLQTIGVPNDAIPALTEGATLATWVPKLAAVPLDFQPGSKWAYSNATGFEVLARIVEVASGQSFDQFVKRRIFQPLGMRASSFGPQAALAQRTMALDPRFADSPCITGKSYFCGSAGLWMTAEDYWRFAEMLLDKGTAGGTRLLRADTVRLMSSNQVGRLFPGSGGLPARGVGFGLGMAVVQDAGAAGLAVPPGSFGWDGVATRRFWVMPQAHTVLIMLIPSGNAAPVHRDIEKAVAAALGSGGERS